MNIPTYKINTFSVGTYIKIIQLNWKNRIVRTFSTA